MSQMTLDDILESSLDDFKKGIGRSDDVFAVVMVRHLDRGEAFSMALVRQVWDEVTVIIKSKPTGRDELDIQDIYSWMLPHTERFKQYTGVGLCSEIFKVIFRP